MMAEEEKISGNGGGPSAAEDGALSAAPVPGPQIEGHEFERLMELSEEGFYRIEADGLLEVLAGAGEVALGQQGLAGVEVPGGELLGEGALFLGLLEEVIAAGVLRPGLGRLALLGDGVIGAAGLGLGRGMFRRRLGRGVLGRLLPVLTARDEGGGEENEQGEGREDPPGHRTVPDLAHFP